MKNYIKNKGLKGLLFSVFVALVFFILSITKAFSSADNLIMDINQRQSTTSAITIIAIDDKTLAWKKRESITRADYATVINNLYTKGGPQVLGIDVLFTGDSDNAANDNLLVEAVSKDNRTVVVGNLLLFGNEMIEDNQNISVNKTITGVSYPYDKLNTAVGKSGSGFVNTILDSSDSVVRKLAPTMKKGNDLYDSFAYTIYKRYAEKNDLNINKYDYNKEYRFKYSGKPGDYEVISFVDIYNGTVSRNFSDDIVLIGAYATGLADDFFTPIDKSQKMNGVEAHANMIDAYIKNDIINEMNNVLLSFIVLIVVFLVAFIIYKSHIILSSAVAAGTIAIFIVLQIVFFIGNIYAPFNLLVLGIVVAYLGILITNYLIEYIRRKRTVNIFKKYVAKEVVEKALKDGDNKIELGGIKKDIAVMFIDIRGFTTLSEALEPGQIVEILNRYLDITSSEILAVGGTLDKFIGDATMAVFNSPFDLDDYEYKAVLAANNIRKRAKELEDECMRLYNKTVRFGIGVNVGEAVVGNIGSQKRMDFTAIGDTVNTASRLEGKALGGEIVISKALKERLDSRVITEFKDNLQLKGKADFVEAYRVIDVLDKPMDNQIAEDDKR